MQEKSRVKLNLASSNGYTLSSEEKMIIKSDNSKRIIAVMTQNTSLNQNLKEMPELHISDKEHEKIVKKTISNVINKLEQQIEI